MKKKTHYVFVAPSHYVIAHYAGLYAVQLIHESIKEVEDYRQLQNDMLRFKKSIVVSPIVEPEANVPKILLMSTEEKKEVADVLNQAKNRPLLQQKQRYPFEPDRKIKISKIMILVAIIIISAVYFKSIITFLIKYF